MMKSTLLLVLGQPMVITMILGGIWFHSSAHIDFYVVSS